MFAGSLFGRLATLARTRTNLHDNDTLRATLTEALPIPLIEDLAGAVRVRRGVDRAGGRALVHGRAAGGRGAGLGRGPGDAAAGRARRRALHRRRDRQLDPRRSRGARSAPTRIFVMHVGRVDRPLEPPRWPWEVAVVAFEIARRHRFIGDLAALPDDVEVHVMPTGQAEPPQVQRPLGAALPRRVGPRREHRARLRRVRRLPGRARPVSRIPPLKIRRVIDRAARARARGAVHRRVATARPRSRRRCRPSSAGGARCGCSRSSSPTRSGTSRRSRPARCCGPPGAAASTARTTRCCAGSSAGSRARRCGWRG